MKLVMSGSAPPPVAQPPDAIAASRGLTAPCGAAMQPISGGWCSSCYEGISHGCRLSDGEILCAVCVNMTVTRAEQYASNPPPWIPLSLFAPLSANGAHELDGVTDLRARNVLLSLHAGERVRCCGCIHSARLARQTGDFVGYCVRRQVAVVRLQHAVVCVPLELLRRPTDRLVVLHSEMLRSLMGVASLSTLQHAVANVRAAHTLCGTSLLESVAASVDAMWERERVTADDEDARTGPASSRQEREPRPSMRPCEPSVGECFPTACGLRMMR